MAYTNQVALQEIRKIDADCQAGTHVGKTGQNGTSVQNGVYVISENQNKNISNGSPKAVGDPAEVKGKRSTI